MDTLDHLVLESDDLQTREPRDAWLHLLKLRRSTFLNLFYELEDDGDPATRRKASLIAAWTPINPVLLGFALAYRVHCSIDNAKVIRRFVGCEDVLYLEEEILTTDEVLAPADCERVLELGVVYLNALIELAYEDLCRKQCLIERSTGQLDVWDLLWATWLILNPICFDPFTRSPFAAGDDESCRDAFRDAVSHGFRSNSLIHNFRVRSEARAAQATYELNKALLDKNALRTLNDLARNHRVCELVYRQARKLYYWAPHEISAYHVSDSLFASEEPADERFLVRAKRLWMLPDSLRDRAVVICR